MLAFHLQGAGRDREAAVEWLDAADRSVVSSRYPEAGHQARRALELVRRLPAVPETDELELRGTLMLASALVQASSGSDEARAAAFRAQELARRLDQVPALLNASCVLVACLQALGEYDHASTVSLDRLMLARQGGFPVHLMLAEHFHGTTLVWQGRVLEGRSILGSVSDQWEVVGPSAALGPELVSIVAAMGVASVSAALAVAVVTASGSTTPRSCLPTSPPAECCG